MQPVFNAVTGGERAVATASRFTDGVGPSIGNWVAPFSSAKVATEALNALSPRRHTLHYAANNRRQLKICRDLRQVTRTPRVSVQSKSSNPQTPGQKKNPPAQNVAREWAWFSSACPQNRRPFAHTQLCGSIPLTSTPLKPSGCRSRQPVSRCGNGWRALIRCGHHWFTGCPEHWHGQFSPNCCRVPKPWTNIFHASATGTEHAPW